MAKGDTKPPHVRTPRPKTPAQLAKRDRNISDYHMRCHKLRQEQQLAKELRLKGYKGNDKAVIAAYEHDKAVRAAAQYCTNVLNCPVHGQVVQRWLASRTQLPPLEVESLIREFLDRDGYNRDGSTWNAKYDNTAMKAAVQSYLEGLNAVQPIALNSKLEKAA